MNQRDTSRNDAGSPQPNGRDYWRRRAGIIELPQGGEIPKCEMPDHVIFLVLAGQADVTVNGQTSTVGEQQCLITAPATFSMKSERGARMVGIQIAAHSPFQGR